jgi:predicted ester cyclase
MERGTHKGTWIGIPPTGNTMSVPGIAIFRIANGQILEQWSHNDLRAALRQLGARIVPGDA